MLARTGLSVTSSRCSCELTVRSSVCRAIAAAMPISSPMMQPDGVVQPGAGRDGGTVERGRVGDPGDDAGRARVARCLQVGEELGVPLGVDPCDGLRLLGVLVVHGDVDQGGVLDDLGVDVVGQLGGRDVQVEVADHLVHQVGAVGEVGVRLGPVGRLEQGSGGVALALQVEPDEDARLRLVLRVHLPVDERDHAGSEQQHGDDRDPTASEHMKELLEVHAEPS